MNSYIEKISPEYLWERYNEIYMAAKQRGETDFMLLATDRQAALMGVRFDLSQLTEDEDE